MTNGFEAAYVEHVRRLRHMRIHRLQSLSYTEGFWQCSMARPSAYLSR